MWPGCLPALPVGGLSFAYARRFITPLGIPDAAMATYQMLLAILGLAPITDLTGITAIARDELALPGVVVGLGIVGTGLSFVLYYVVVNRLGALTASAAMYISPVVAMIIGVGVLHEPLYVTTIVTVALILAAAIQARADPYEVSGPSKRSTRDPRPVHKLGDR